MSLLANSHIAELLEPFYPALSVATTDQFALYLDLLTKWNAKTNLTAVRTPEEVVTRHFGESLFAAQFIGDRGTLLDVGSGAGFPGLPIQLAHPDLIVTLAESQNKKAAFLREVVRQLNLKTTVWAARVEAMPPDRRFDYVSSRAVDDAAAAQATTEERVRDGGLLVHIGKNVSDPPWEARPIPNSDGRAVLLRRF